MPTPRKYATHAERQAAYRVRQAEAREKGGVIHDSSTIPTRPGYRRWAAMAGAAQTVVERIIAEMESYYEERSERWQDSEQGEGFIQKKELLEEAASLMRELV